MPLQKFIARRKIALQVRNWLIRSKVENTVKIARNIKASTSSNQKQLTHFPQHTRINNKLGENTVY